MKKLLLPLLIMFSGCSVVVENAYSSAEVSELDSISGRLFTTSTYERVLFLTDLSVVMVVDTRHDTSYYYIMGNGTATSNSTYIYELSGVGPYVGDYVVVTLDGDDAAITFQESLSAAERAIGSSSPVSGNVIYNNIIYLLEQMSPMYSSDFSESLTVDSINTDTGVGSTEQGEYSIDGGSSFPLVAQKTNIDNEFEGDGTLNFVVADNIVMYTYSDADGSTTSPPVFAVVIDFENYTLTLTTATYLGDGQAGNDNYYNLYQYITGAIESTTEWSTTQYDLRFNSAF